MINSVLPEFQEFLRSRSLAAEKNIPFYAYWVSRFLYFSDSHQAVFICLRIEKFIKDIAGFTNRDELIEKMQVYFENFSYLVDCVFEAWNISPRWELGGRAPRDLKINDRPFMAISGNKSVKTRRNDPCPCGSGKKYKKCCGR